MFSEVRKIIVSIVLDSTSSQPPSACSYIRLILPFMDCKEDDVEINWVTPQHDLDKIKSDILICQRTTISNIDYINRIVNHCYLNNIRIIYDIDDLLFYLPNNHPERGVYNTHIPGILRWLTAADEVWASTAKLKANILPFNPKVTVIPNTLSRDLFAAIPQKIIEEDNQKPIRLLIMGTPTHNDDFNLIKNDLERLKKEFGDRVEINVIGMISEKLPDQFFKNITPSELICSSYPKFISWLSNQPSFDIGIVPLVDNEFNRCKSDIKFLDYSALGMVTIASDTDGNSRIKNGVNGFRVGFSEAEWYYALKRIMLDRELLNSIKKQAYQDVFLSNDYQQSHKLRINRIREVKSAERKQHLEALNWTDLNLDRNIIAQMLLFGKGIEVGALHNPQPVKDYVEVRYVDRFDKTGLYEQYPELRGLDLVEVDYVDNGETLLSFDDASQDFIIANHFLEHCQDPINTLKSFFRVLRNNGILFLALPDKRYTFDVNRERTTLDHLIRDHNEGPQVSRFEHFIDWPKFVEPHFGRIYSTIDQIEERAKELMDSDYSIHYHVWQPEDISELIDYCVAELKMPIRTELFVSKNDEMIVILRKCLTLEVE